MDLLEDNFVVKMITIEEDRTYNILDITNNMKLQRNNSSKLFGYDSNKYKLIFNNITIPKNSMYIIFQIDIKINDNYYTPYSFQIIKNDYTSDNNYAKTPGCVNYLLYNNHFKYIWFYLVKENIIKMINTTNKNNTNIKTIVDNCFI